MNNNELLNYFDLQQQIFGTRPYTGEIFRLSDCRIYTRKKPENDWLQLIKKEFDAVAAAQERLDTKEKKLREEACAAGRQEVNNIVRKIDTVFRPLRLDPDDAKVLFHPIDYVVFQGMKTNNFRSILLVDRSDRSSDEIKVQRSIEQAVERKQYEWVTLRIEENGAVSEE